MAKTSDAKARQAELAESEKAARALENEGKYAEVVSALSGFINLTAHDGAVVPCLCRKCLDPARHTVETGGIVFHRSFACAQGRVLWYWVPDALGGDLKTIAASVQSSLETKFQLQAKSQSRR